MLFAVDFEHVLYIVGIYYTFMYARKHILGQYVVNISLLF